PSAPISVVHVHGARDDFVPLTGGPGALGVTYPTTERALDFWSERDGCDPTPELAALGADVTARRYARCRSGTSVEIYEVERAKHGSPAAPRRARLLSALPQKFDATRALWRFFAAHPKAD